MNTVLATLVAHQNLSASTMKDVLHEMMQGSLDPAWSAAFLMGLQCKGVSAEELSAAARVIRELAPRFHFAPDKLAKAVDIVGTGGDGANLFNISTAATFVVAACGVPVLKHLGRAVSSRSGSGEVLSQLGIRLDLSPPQLERCFQQTDMAFIYAPQHHACFKHVTALRQSLGMPTLFNLLGPLTNPATIDQHFIGVSDRRWLMIFAETLHQLGSARAVVAHAQDGLDEISLAAPTDLVRLNHGRLETQTISPADFALSTTSLDPLRVTNGQESAMLILKTLRNEQRVAKNIVCLNAAAALYAADVVDDLQAGFQQSLDAITSGAALDKLATVIECTQQLKDAEDDHPVTE